MIENKKQEIVLKPSPLPYKPEFRKQATLTLITVDENTSRLINFNKLRDSPPPYEELEDISDSVSIPMPAATIGNNLASQHGQSCHHNNKVAPERPRQQPNEDVYQSNFTWAKLGRFFAKRPILKLFLVIFINGLISMAFAAIFIELEAPSQLERMKYQQDSLELLHSLETNLSRLLRQKSEDSLDKFEEYQDRIKAYQTIPEEIQWEMLSASAFVTGVSTTTGYGDIVPSTVEGKILTIFYALYGIPVFLWYIIKLGALFRVVVMRFLRNFADCWKFSFTSCFPRRDRKNLEAGMQNLVNTTARPIVKNIPTAEISNFIEELEKDKRFHPSVIGIILLLFMLSVAFFISHMESITYFDSVYACFITYSTIGFGDIDIYRISYRSNWFNLMIYGNGVHVIGYMLLSASISSILEKFSGKRDINQKNITG